MKLLTFANEQIADNMDDGVPTVDVVPAECVPSVDFKAQPNEDGHCPGENAPKSALIRGQFW